LNKVAAALQKQVTRDFGPLWNTIATVDAFTSLDDVPIDYWPIIIRDDINAPGAAGFHQDENGQPYALVEFSPSWPLTASHECLEMLADPSGNRTVAGAAPDLYLQKKPHGSARVGYLVEVCDPCESSQYAYTVNGVTVSDFITPHFYDPQSAPSVRYSFEGSITAPRQVLPGGYISFRDPVDGEWYQVRYFQGEPQLAHLNINGQIIGNLRSTIDRQTPHVELEHGITDKGVLAALTARRDAADTASVARARALNRQITALKKTGDTGGQ
jgi:hypothetical protein